jgi:hypothetical protein
MTTKSAAAATQPGVAAAASALLAKGNAVDAVCAAVAMAAALDASVLFGPLHLLVAGPGLGLRCIDGRLREPGRAAPRPRGFVTEEEVPECARVAVPALPAALATALSMFGTLSAPAVFDSAIASLARKHPRREVLAALARGGPSVLSHEPFADALVAVAGRMAGGSLTAEDLGEVRAPALACDTDGGIARAPFAVREDGDTIDSRSCHAVCATDHRGGIAIACYEIATDGFELAALGVVAPLRADPVMRGKRRTDPGAALPCASSIFLAHSTDDRWDIAAGFGDSSRVAGCVSALAKGELLEAALRERSPSCGVIRTKRAPSAYSFTP